MVDTLKNIFYFYPEDRIMVQGIEPRQLLGLKHGNNDNSPYNTILLCCSYKSTFRSRKIFPRPRLTSRTLRCVMDALINLSSDNKASLNFETKIKETFFFASKTSLKNAEQIGETLIFVKAFAHIFRIMNLIFLMLK